MFFRHSHAWGRAMRPMTNSDGAAMNGMAATAGAGRAAARRACSNTATCGS